MRVAQNLRIQVRGRTGDQDIGPLGSNLRQGCSLQEANCGSIHADKKAHIGIAHQAFITKERHLLGFGRRDDARSFLRVMRNQNERFHARINKLLRLLELQFVVALRRFDQDIGTEFAGAFLEIVKIRLPALDF